MEPRKAKEKKERNIPGQIQQLRKKIDQTDRKLLHLLYIRFNTVEEIACLKREIGIPVLQRGRWQELLKDRVQLAQGELRLNPEFTRKLFTLIHQEALRIQRQIVKRSCKRNRSI